MNAPAKIQPVAYSLSNAFAASGYISGTLMRLQWSDRFAAMEAELAAAWRKEARPNPQQLWHGLEVEPRAERSQAAIQAASETCAAKREARYAKVIEVLKANGPQKCAGICNLLRLTETPVKRMMSEMEAAGLVNVFRSHNGRSVVYSAEADWSPEIDLESAKAPKRTISDRMALLESRRLANYAVIAEVLASGPLRLSEIAERVDFSPRSTAEYLNSMVSRGLVIRREGHVGGLAWRKVTYEVPA